MSDEKPAADGHAARMEFLKKEIERLEDLHLVLYQKLESKKLDIFFMGAESPRGLHMKEEAKKILSELIECRRGTIVAGREYAKLIDMEIEVATKWKWVGETTEALAEVESIANEVKDIAARVTPIPTDRPPGEP